MNEDLQQLLNALPQHFEFYHLGQVELKNLECSFTETSAIAFRIFGDLTAVVIFLFDKDLDASIYSELGNVVVSRIVSEMNAKGTDVMVSPPQELSESQVEKLAAQTSPTFRRTYAHLYQNTVIPIETLILQAPSEGIGYA